MCNDQAQMRVHFQKYMFKEASPEEMQCPSPTSQPCLIALE